MSHRKKHIIGFSGVSNEEKDAPALSKNADRSEVIREVAKKYVTRQKNAFQEESLRNGYREMADINLEIAEACLEADNIQQQCYEEKLAECE